MEIILQGSQGVPDGGVLSIKIGETKRQAPVSKIGQPFHFASSPAEPLLVKIELLTPAAPSQTVTINPAEDQFVVDFNAEMKVMLAQRHVEALQRPVVNVGEAAEARGLPQEKIQMAQNAAAYLEKHDLVRTFQDILHGLLVSKPENPWRYLDDHIARAKALAVHKAGAVAGGGGAAAAREPTSAELNAINKGPRRSAGARSSVRGSMRGSIVSRSKVETLLDILTRTRKNIDLVMRYLPENLKDLLVSDGLAEECSKRFRELDTKQTGVLEPNGLIPVILQLSTANATAVSENTAKRFCDIFDTNKDGLIQRDEFVTLTQFVLIAAHLESVEGKKHIETAQLETARFEDFLDILANDKNRINDVVPFLPDWLVKHLTSEQFMDDCTDQFDYLDADLSNSLEPEELIPIILSLSKLDVRAVTQEKIKKFVSIFDVYNNGVIMRDEFIEFAQFLTVMNFLTCTVEGEQVNEAAQHVTNIAKLDRLIGELEKDRDGIARVMGGLPPSLVNDIASDGFAKECVDGFKDIDSGCKGVLVPEEVYPLAVKMTEAHPISMQRDAFNRYTKLFDRDRNGVVSMGEIVRFMRYIICMAWLVDTREWHDAEISGSQERIEWLLKFTKEHCEKLEEVMPMLPNFIQSWLTSQEFKDQCMEEFAKLDKDSSGVLEPRELTPLVIELSQAHPFALTSDQCQRFIELFDTERNGVIMTHEFVQFASFMIILSFLETREGRAISQSADLSIGRKRVEELLGVLERDRSAAGKVVPLLPKTVFEHLTSDSFVTQCGERFQALDKDKNGVLDSLEVFPVVVELSNASPAAVNMEQCTRFTTIFDVHGDGVIRMDEFLDFARFLCIMSYLYSDEGKQQASECLQIMADSKAIEDLIGMLRRDRREVRKVIPYLPTDIHTELLSENFTVTCLNEFDKLDKDGNGSLDPEELFPLVIQLTEVHKLALDIDQCRRFADIFDDARTGMISKEEYVNFARFMVVMTYLQTEDGQTVLDMACTSETGENASIMDSGSGGSPPRAEALSGRGNGAHGERGYLASDAAVEHMAVDLEYFKGKSEKLTKENEALRSRLSTIEAQMREMSDRLEKQDYRLRHAEVDLGVSAGSSSQLGG